MTKKYQKIMDDYNVAHEAEDRAVWEIETRMRRTRIDRQPVGRTPQWKYTKATGKMVREGKSGGIDWMRYQMEVLEPKFVPFLKSLPAGHIAQEDNAPAHASQWNKQLWVQSGIEVLEWPPNSPDLSAIEPPWAQIKFKGRKKKVPRSRAALEQWWKAAWKSYPQEKLQRMVERVLGNVKWVIRLAGGNTYQEGTEPPLLPEGVEEPAIAMYKEWLAKSSEERQEEDPTYREPGAEDLEELSEIEWNEADLLVGL